MNVCDRFPDRHYFVFHIQAAARGRADSRVMLDHFRFTPRRFVFDLDRSWQALAWLIPIPD